MAEQIGRVVLLQIQRSVLVDGPTFDPKPLLRVDRVLVSSTGLLGSHDGGWIVDAHNSAHPATGLKRRPVSIGFSAHYDHMRERFGHVPLGVAGENIIVETDQMFTEADLSRGLVVLRSDGAELRITAPKVARPCVQFSRFLVGDADPEAVKAARTFLRDGVRGFICGVGHLDGVEPIEVGDEVWLAD